LYLTDFSYIIGIDNVNSIKKAGNYTSTFLNVIKLKTSSNEYKGRCPPLFYPIDIYLIEIYLIEK